MNDGALMLFCFLLYSVKNTQRLKSHDHLDILLMFYSFDYAGIEWVLIQYGEAKLTPFK